MSWKGTCDIENIPVTQTGEGDAAVIQGQTDMTATEFPVTPSLQ